MPLCKFCGKECKNPGSLSTHEPYCKSNPGRVQREKSPLAHKRKGSTTWNKGLTSKVDSRILNGKDHPNFGKVICTEHSAETKIKLSQVARGRNFGGRVEGSGRGKKGWYKGFFCDSSWELAYLIYQLEHNVKIARSTEVRYYEWEGKRRKYYPDFIVNDEVVEIKGYKTKQWEAKLTANPDVKVLYESELQPYLKYVIEKYGRDFIKMYDQRKSKSTGDENGLENRRA